jgi:transposase InsO family protein
MVATPHPPLTDVMIERPTELLHMDLVGPVRVRSVGRKWYVLVVVDDYSRYAWVFFLEDKSETFGFVRDLIVRLKNERHGNAIRAIHSDNGSEFKNSSFDAFCRDLGLEHQYSTPYVPPQNGVVERKIELFVRWLGRCSMSTGL